MPNISSKSFTQLVTDMVTAVQGRAVALIDFTIGSVLRAIVEAIAAVAVWLESLILVLLQTTRASSSSGADLDSWMADYDFFRLEDQAATGAVTFARFTPTAQALVPVGALVQTTDGSQQYTVIADTTQPAFNAAQNGYLIPAGTPSAVATVEAVLPGAAGNVAAGSITIIAQAIPYVDTVNNTAALDNGADAESDPSFRARFVVYIANLSKATKGAIANAILGLAQGISYTLVENQNYNGTYRPGYFYAVIDDGTGSPSSEFLSTASNVIDTVRGFTIGFGVFAPIVVPAAVAMAATITAGYDPTATKALVRTAVLNYINSLTLGQPLSYTRLAQIAFDASPGVVNITGLTLNGGMADLAATGQQVIKASGVVVN